ncbi:sugar ABC transporter substrate-binding protein [Clostridium sp. HCP1S3_B4]|uniref:sugar ABC transporter substrate-binding protein n=1 Tax=unclassified Clostridium TaxID=2614128 RepID=UPI002A7B02FC|nr:extracellular solute-binding protein [Clostridiales bacterium]MDY2729296.1 extracellular solute-binding protein [Clostridium sp.]
MKKIKKIISMCIALATTICILQGCTDNKKKETYSEDTLNIWANMINDDSKTYNEIAEKWSENHNGMKVNFIDSDVSATDYIENELKPDIVLGMDTREAEKVVLAKCADEIPGELFSDDEFTSKDLIDVITINGKKYGVPFTQDTPILFYRKDKVNNVPETMEDLIKDAEDVGFTTTIDDKFINYGFMSAYGGYYYKYNEDGTFDDHNIGCDTKEAIEGYEFIYDLVNKYKFCLAGTTDMMATNGFESGKCGYYIGEYGRVRTFNNHNIDFGVSKIPTLNGNEVKPFKIVTMSVVNPNSSKKDLAWDFLRYFMDEASEYVMTSNPKAPVLKKSLDTDSYKNSEYLSEFYKQSLSAEPYPNIISASIYGSAIDNNISAMTLKQMTPEECASQIKSDLIESREQTITGSSEK